MIQALVVLLLAQAPMSPPPLIEADFLDPALRPPTPPNEPAAVSEPPQVTASEDAATFGGRVAATFTGALVGSAPAVAIIALGLGLCGNDPDCMTLSLLTGILSAPVTTGLGAWLGHRLAGGKGSFGKAVAGAALGWGLSMFTIYGLGLVGQATSAPMEWGLVGAGSAVAFLITSAVLEYSHHSELEQLGLGVSPVEGGALVSLGGHF